MLKVQEIRELIKLIDESSITEFKYETEDAEVFLKKATGEVQSPAPVVQTATPQPAEQAAPAPQQDTQTAQPVNEPSADQNETQKEEKSEASSDFDHEITSPMVGTFYAAPSPDDDPYVQVGDQVGEDSVVCIVEAMKLFNEIEAEAKGKIVEILVEDGELVEYGQPLFRIKKA